MSWTNGRLVAFDVETTGVDYETDRIVTAHVGAIAAQGAPGARRETTTHDWLLNPGVDIPAGATEVHGITTEFARANGTPAAEAIARITDVLAIGLAGGAALVAFNARFDLTMLDRECRRHGVAPLADRQVDVHVIDPFVLDKQIARFRRGKRTLGVLCEHYDVVLDDAHSADADALAAARLAFRMGRQFPELGNLPLPALHARQEMWAAEQAASLEAYFRRQGKDETCERAWPVVPVPAVGARAAA